MTSWVTISKLFRKINNSREGPPTEREQMTDIEKIQERIEQIRRNRAILQEEEARLCQEREALKNPATAPLIQFASYGGSPRAIIKITKDIYNYKGQWVSLDTRGRVTGSRKDRYKLIDHCNYILEPITFGAVSPSFLEGTI